MRSELRGGDQAPPEVRLSPLAAEEERATRWLARFSPLLDGLDSPDPRDSLTAEECRRRLREITALRAEGRELSRSLNTRPDAAETGLGAVLADAVRELDAQEADHRRRLGTLSPGDPEGAVDLASLRSRIARAAARREVASWTGDPPRRAPAALELKSGPPNLAMAVTLGLISAGWLTFLVVHALLLVGGFVRVFGPRSLFLLLFYAVFFCGGLGMGWMALRALAREEIILEGRHLILRRRFPVRVWERRYRLGADSRAYATLSFLHRAGGPVPEIGILDETGAELRFASGRPAAEMERLISRLNTYLDTATAEE